MPVIPKAISGNTGLHSVTNGRLRGRPRHRARAARALVGKSRCVCLRQNPRRRSPSSAPCAGVVVGVPRRRVARHSVLRCGGARPFACSYLRESLGVRAALARIPMVSQEPRSSILRWTARPFETGRWQDVARRSHSFSRAGPRRRCFFFCSLFPSLFPRVSGELARSCPCPRHVVRRLSSALQHRVNLSIGRWAARAALLHTRRLVARRRADGVGRVSSRLQRFAQLLPRRDPHSSNLSITLGPSARLAVAGPPSAGLAAVSCPGGVVLWCLAASKTLTPRA